MRMLARQAIEMMERAILDIRSGLLDVAEYRAVDETTLEIHVVLCTGLPAAVEQAMASAGMDAIMPSAVGPGSAWQSPVPTSSCRSCGSRGTLRSAGPLAWLCIACNAETSPPDGVPTGG